MDAKSKTKIKVFAAGAGLGALQVFLKAALTRRRSRATDLNSRLKEKEQRYSRLIELRKRFDRIAEAEGVLSKGFATKALSEFLRDQGQGFDNLVASFGTDQFEGALDSAQSNAKHRLDAIREEICQLENHTIGSADAPSKL